jgi:NDP-sugar pyrophosphorylase family protein
VVLAGGYPWSESAFDALAPRVLLQVAHQPLLAWSLCWLEEAGVREVTICATPATAGPIDAFVADSFPTLRATLSVDTSPRGPAGCVKDAVESDPARTYVVVDGSVVPTAPLGPLLAAHRKARAALSVVAHEELARGAAPTLRVPSGTYLFDDRALDLVPARGFYDIKENLIPRLYALGERVSAQVVPGACPRVLNRGSYLAVNHWLVDTLSAREAPPGYVGLGDAVVHVSARIDVDAIVAGPVLVGAEATLMSGANVVGPAVIGRGSVVERGALVSRSVTWSDCLVGRDAFVDRSVVADRAAVPPGARLIGAVHAPAPGELAARAKPEPAAPATLPQFLTLRARGTV